MKTKAIEGLYNQKIAENYDTDRFGLLTESRNAALGQIMENVSAAQVNSILDMALGTGTTLKNLSEYFPEASLSGIDISAEMIRLAREKMQITAWHADARDIGSYILPQSQDLILVHYLFAYVDPNSILAAALSRLKTGGLCSIATTTYQNFAAMQKLAAEYLSEDALRVAQVPDNPDALLDQIRACGFEVIAVNAVRKQILLNNIIEAVDWGIKSSWLTQYLVDLDIGILDKLSASKELFPLEDEFQAMVILAKKPDATRLS